MLRTILTYALVFWFATAVWREWNYRRQRKLYRELLTQLLGQLHPEQRELVQNLDRLAAVTPHRKLVLNRKREVAYETLALAYALSLYAVTRLRILPLELDLARRLVDEHVRYDTETMALAITAYRHATEGLAAWQRYRTLCARQSDRHADGHPVPSEDELVNRVHDLTLLAGNNVLVFVELEHMTQH